MLIYPNLCSHTGKQTQNKTISIGNVLVRHITVVKRHNYSLKIDGLSRHEPNHFSNAPMYEGGEVIAETWKGGR